MIARIAAAAVVLGLAGSIAASYRISIGFARYADTWDVRTFVLLFWGGVLAAALSAWGALALRRMGVRGARLAPFALLAIAAALPPAGFYLHMRVPAVRTASYALGRWIGTYGMSREVPRPTRQVPGREGES